MTEAFSSIVFLDVDQEDRARVEKRFPGARIFRSLPVEDVLRECIDSEAVCFFTTTSFSREIISRLPRLKLLATRSVGYDHIDLLACKERGIVVTNVPDYGSQVIAEHVFALLLSTIRHIPEGDKRVEGGVFDYHGLRGISLRNKTIGIVGTGRIGRRVACIARGFGMRILAADRFESPELTDLLSVAYVSLPELLKQSDIISLHMPATEETFHVIDAKAFSQMKDGVILVNTARGSLIDSQALLQAVRSGKVKYALLDVLEHEPNFEENKELIAEPAVITTPHIAFYADDSMSNMFEDCFQSIERWLAGQAPEHIVREPATKD